MALSRFLQHVSDQLSGGMPDCMAVIQQQLVHIAHLSRRHFLQPDKHCQQLHLQCKQQVLRQFSQIPLHHWNKSLDSLLAFDTSSREIQEACWRLLLHSYSTQGNLHSKHACWSCCYALELLACSLLKVLTPHWDIQYPNDVVTRVGHDHIVGSNAMTCCLITPWPGDGYRGSCHGT